MKPPFYKLSAEQRSHLLDTIYTGMLAINLLFLQSLLGVPPTQWITTALINFAVGIPASAGAIIARRIHQSSTPVDRTMGSIALLNTLFGIAAALWRFSPEVSLTFLGSGVLAAIMVLLGHNLFPVTPPSNDSHPTALPPPEHHSPAPHQEQKRKRRR